MPQLQRCIVVVLVGLFVTACSGLSSEPVIVGAVPTSPPTAVRVIRLPEAPPDLALGAQVFAENCTRCHGLSGAGDGELVKSGQVPPMLDFTDARIPHEGAPIAWYEVVTNGRLDKLMPPWGDSLSEAERWAVTLYVYTLANTPQQRAQGQSIWGDHCAACHGAAGEGTAQGAPLPNLLEVSDAALLATLSEAGADETHAFALAFAPDERAAVLAYARTLSAAPLEIADAALSQTAESPSSTQEVTTATQPAALPVPSEAVTPPLATQEVSLPADEVVMPSSTQEVSAETEVMGVVSGSVVNQTAGAAIPENLTLTLHAISTVDTQAQPLTLAGTVDASGSYRFADVPIRSGWEYVVTATYQQAVFSSEPVSGSPSAPQLDIPLSIYEVTDDPAVIRVSNLLTMVQMSTQPDTLEVVQIVGFSNTSDRVFLRPVSGRSASVSVSLPLGAVYEDLSEGSYLASPDRRGITDTQPVFPGDPHVMHVAFTLPYNGQAAIDQPMDYALDGQVEVMVDRGLAVSGDGITTLGTRQLGNVSYVSYGGPFSLPVDASLRYEVKNEAAAQATSAPAGFTTAAYVLIGAGLLAVGVALGFFLRERTAPAANAASTPVAERDSGMKALVQQIAELDIRYQEGKLKKSEYERQRSALKARLLAETKAQAEKRGK